MATDHVDVAPSDQKALIRGGEGTVVGDAASVPASEPDESGPNVTPDATGRRRSAHLLRCGVSVATVAAFVVLVLGKRTALTRSLGRIGHPQWSWIALGVLLEASSMATFAMMQRRLLRVGGKRVGTGSMMATTLAANALSVSVPVAGPELGAGFTFRRFKEQGADTSLAGWALLVGGIASWFGARSVLPVPGGPTQEQGAPRHSATKSQDAHREDGQPVGEAQPADLAPLGLGRAQRPEALDPAIDRCGWVLNGMGIEAGHAAHPPCRRT